jgi:hypothetical protein
MARLRGRKNVRRAFAPILMVAMTFGIVAFALADDHGTATEKATSVYMKAARGRTVDQAPGVTVYTNATLSKLYGTLPEKPIPVGQSYTTKDLVDRYGEPLAAADGAQPDPGSDSGTAEAYDPLQALQDEQTQRASREQRIQTAEAELALAQQKVDDLKVQLLATRNPFSARPKLSDEEKAERLEAGETASERNERTQALYEEAEAELKAAQERLAQAKAGN